MNNLFTFIFLNIKNNEEKKGKLNRLITNRQNKLKEGKLKYKYIRDKKSKDS